MVVLRAGHVHCPEDKQDDCVHVPAVVSQRPSRCACVVHCVMPALTFPDVDSVGLVRQPQLLKGHGYLLPIGGCQGVELDLGGCGHGAPRGVLCVSPRLSRPGQVRGVAGEQHLICDFRPCLGLIKVS